MKRSGISLPPHRQTLTRTEISENTIFSMLLSGGYYAGEAKWFKLTVDGDYDKIIVHSIGGTAVNGELYDALNELVCSDTQVDSIAIEGFVKVAETILIAVCIGGAIYYVSPIVLQAILCSLPILT